MRVSDCPPPPPRRSRGPGRLLTGVLAGSLTAGLVLSGATSSVATAATASVSPGAVGPVITLSNNHQLDGYDVATDASGRAYVGWIADATTGSSRTVYLCTLPPGAHSCLGGITSTPSLGIDSAVGLKVLVPSDGHVTLVWFHDTSPGSIQGPRGGRIATATAVAGGDLSAPVDRADAPSFGLLQDAALGSGGSIWTVATGSSGALLEVHRGLTSPATKLNAPYMVGYARIAVSGTRAVVAITKGGSIGTPPASSYYDGSWHGFSAVPRTWSIGIAPGLASTRSGFRLITGTDNASYQPVVSAFTGTRFAAPTPTGDTNPCSPFSHDLSTDASGRLVDVSQECNQVTVNSLADTRHGTILRFPSQGTFAQGVPQVATTPRGLAWVAWSVQLPSAPNGAVLRVRAIRLPGTAITVRKKSAAGRLRLVGPVSCLPAVDFATAATAKGRHGWRAGTVRLRLNSSKLGKGKRRAHGTIHGASLSPGATYHLRARAVLRGPGGKHGLSAKITFRSCPTA